MRKGWLTLLMGMIALSSLTSCSSTMMKDNMKDSAPSYGSCSDYSGWALVHEDSLNYHFRCADATNHYYSCYGEDPCQGNHVAMYLYRGMCTNHERAIAGPVWATISNPSDFVPMQKACVEMYNNLHMKKYKRMKKKHY